MAKRKRVMTEQLKFYVALEVPYEKFEDYETMQNTVWEGVATIANLLEGTVEDVEIK